MVCNPNGQRSGSPTVPKLNITKAVKLQQHVVNAQRSHRFTALQNAGSGTARPQGAEGVPLGGAGAKPARPRASTAG